ncbi:MAG: hypothetical protein NZL88_11820, partial [Gaiellaceae bacterium]|nr:hypothetical protein [Gaiellaceae bacterium]
CDSVGPIARYRWSIDGAVAETTACTHTAYLPEGVYPVILETLDADGRRLGTRAAMVPIQDWLIVAVGDSFGSGEGNPEEPADLLAGQGPRWQNKRCHRSGKASGQARAAYELEQADPRTSVTLVHLSCSGATIVKGLIGPYEGAEPPSGDPPPLPPQLERAAELIGDREIDALVISIGGNDANFADIVVNCIITEPCHTDDAEYVGNAVRAGFEVTFCGLLDLTSSDLGDACRAFFQALRPDPTAGELFEDGLDRLEVRYGDLDERIDELFEGLREDSSRVYITEYPNATEDENGEVCELNLGDDPLRYLPGWSKEEGSWVRRTMTPAL